MTNYHWQITRDGVSKGVYETHDEAFGALLGMQPHSVDHATTYEGWKIVNYSRFDDDTGIFVRYEPDREAYVLTYGRDTVALVDTMAEAEKVLEHYR